MNDCKLKTWLERHYKNIEIHHTTVTIPITQKTSADKMLKTCFSDDSQPFNGRCIIAMENLIEIVENIARRCIVYEERKIQRENDRNEQCEQGSKRVKYSSYFDNVSSEDEEPDSDDKEFVVDDDEEIEHYDSSEKEESTDESTDSCEDEEPDSDDNEVALKYYDSSKEEKPTNNDENESFDSNDIKKPLNKRRRE